MQLCVYILVHLLVDLPANVLALHEDVAPTIRLCATEFPLKSEVLMLLGLLFAVLTAFFNDEDVAFTRRAVVQPLDQVAILRVGLPCVYTDMCIDNCIDM